MKRLTGLVWVSALLSVLPLGCVYDADHRCGPHQQILDNDRCGCDDGYVPGAAGCVPCGDKETATNGECFCIDGYARAAADAACEAIPDTLGVACDSDNACPAGKYSLCHVTDGTSGYCTNACSEATDCDGGYRCHEDTADSYCRRPPVGYLDPCESDAACTGEATFCETIRTHQCLVACSAGKTDVCFEGEVCCDFTLFAPICVPADACSMSGTQVN